MLDLLKPNLYVDHLRDIPLAELSRQGIKGLIIDLDNTITEWNSFELKKEILAWFSSLADYDLQTCLVSNNNHGRVEYVADQLGVPFIPSAAKPRRKAFRKALTILGTNQKETAVIGDQIFTDILGGNRLELLTILVVPLTGKEFIGTKLVRRLERLVLSNIIKHEPGR